VKIRRMKKSKRKKMRAKLVYTEYKEYKKGYQTEIYISGTDVENF
jgi:hypothetical protein